MPGKHRSTAAGRRRALHPALLAGALVAVALVAVLVVLKQLDSTSTTAGAPPSPTPSTSSTSSAPETGTTTPAPSTTPTPTPTPTAPTTPRSVTLDLLVTGKSSFVMVQVPGGATLFTGIAAKGRALRFDQPKLAVVLGSAGDVRIVVNGRPKASSGKGVKQVFTATKG